jgi:hypothetical protein
MTDRVYSGGSRDAISAVPTGRRFLPLPALPRRWKRRAIFGSASGAGERIILGGRTDDLRRERIDDKDRTGRMQGGNVLERTVLEAVAEQMMRGAEVAVEGHSFRVTWMRAQRLRTVRFLMGGKEYQAIQQNSEKPSRWGKLAREGHRVVQFRDLQTQKYVAVAVDGKVKEYGR